MEKKSRAEYMREWRKSPTARIYFLSKKIAKLEQKLVEAKKELAAVSRIRVQKSERRLPNE